MLKTYLSYFEGQTDVDDLPPIWEVNDVSRLEKRNYFRIYSFIIPYLDTVPGRLELLSIETFKLTRWRFTVPDGIAICSFLWFYCWSVLPSHRYRGWKGSLMLRCIASLYNRTWFNCTNLLEWLLFELSTPRLDFCQRCVSTTEIRLSKKLNTRLQLFHYADGDIVYTSTRIHINQKLDFRQICWVFTLQKKMLEKIRVLIPNDDLWSTNLVHKTDTFSVQGCLLI